MTDYRKNPYTGRPDLVATKAEEIEGLAVIARTGNWADLVGEPVLPGVATAYQGTLAETALQPTGDGSGLRNMTKSQIGLGNVNNTADADKPVSTATQSALDSKASTSHKSSHATGGGDALTPSDIGAAKASDYAQTIGTGDLFSRGPWVDVRAFGAKCDEVTDDSAAVNAAVAFAGEVRPVLITGICAISDTIVLGNQSQLIINGRLKALPAMAADKPLIKVAGASSPAWNARILGGGVVDGANVVDTGVLVHWGRETTISDIKVLGVNKYPIQAGATGTAYPSTGCNINNVLVRWHEAPSSSPLMVNGSYANHAASVGVYHKNCTDSEVTKVQVIGYRKGFVMESGSVHYALCHSWGGRVHGPFVAGFEFSSSGGSAVQCYADTPHNWYWNGSAYVQDASITDVYGFLLTSYSQYLCMCQVNINADVTQGATDNLVSAVHMSTSLTSGGYGAIIGTMVQGSSAAYRYKNVYSGNTMNAVILGTGTPSYLANAGSKFDQLGPVNTRVPSSILFGSTSCKIDGAAGTNREFALTTDSLRRWGLRAALNSETGSDQGSDFYLQSYHDDGTAKDEVLIISRRWGTVQFGGSYNGTRPVIGTYNLWVGTDGALRAKASSPASANDGGAFGLKVAVPANATASGQPGQWAADASYIYIYTGDGTTHAWRRASIGTW